MKKALHPKDKAYMAMRGGKLVPEEMNIQEILAAINKCSKDNWNGDERVEMTLDELHGHICRYLKQGLTEDFLNEINSYLSKVTFHQYVLPTNFYSVNETIPYTTHVANLDLNYDSSVVAAKEFARLIATELLDKVKKCRLPDCDNLYIGPPNSKWCSKTCGSKYRQRKARGTLRNFEKRPKP